MNSGSKVVLSLTRGWLAVLAVLLAAPWLLCLAMFLYRGHETTSLAHRTAGLPANAVQGHAEPWGTLVYTPLVIAPPIEYIDQLDPRQTNNPWYFDGMSTTAVAEFLTKAGVPDAMRQRLMAAAKPMDPPAVGLVVKPDDDIVHDLSPEARANIYHRLAEFDLNRDQVNAVRFLGKSPEEWFDRSDLTPETVALIKPYVYRHGPFMFFADFGRILPSISDDRQREQLAKALARTSTLMVRLYVDEGADVEALVRYWGRGKHENDVRPVLESLARGYGGGSIGITRLLPLFARERIYAYTPPKADVAGLNRDCHWNGLNFFNDDADDRLADPAQQKLEFETKYQRIFGNLMFGDLVLFFEGEDRLIHTAVYIADDILYTKNGNRSTEPAMFIRMEDMKDFYPRSQPLRLQYFRRKDL